MPASALPSAGVVFGAVAFFLFDGGRSERASILRTLHFDLLKGLSRDL